MSKWGWDCWGYQGSKGTLCSCNQDCRSYMYNSSQGGRGLLCRSSTHPATIPCREYARCAAWGHRKRVGFLIFFGVLQSGSTSLSPQSPWGTHVPLAVTNWEHVFNHSFGDYPLLATAIRELTRTASPIMSETLTPAMGTKQWHCSSSWEVASSRSGEEEATVLDVTLEEQPHWRWKDGRALAKLLKRSCCEAFDKDSDLVKVTRLAYFNAHHPEFNHESSLDQSQMFWEIANSAGLLHSDIYKVQDVWTGWKDLWVTHHMARSSLKVMGLKGIHSPKALKCWASLSFCQWCGKKGQNEGRVGHREWQRWWFYIWLGALRVQVLPYPNVHARAGFSSQPLVILPVFPLIATCFSTATGHIPP